MTTSYHSLDPCLPAEKQHLAYDQATSASTTGPLTPLRNGLFRNLWVATLISNLGSWMLTVGEAWLMTSLTPSALMVSLMQIATMAPMFLLSLPAGVMADVVSRRLILTLTQGWMMLISAILALTAALGLVSVPLLLILSTALGIGTALNGPAWRAITPEIVDPEDLPQAVVLNGLSVNATRSIGPALGGLVIASMGTAAVFALNALSFVFVLVVLVTWKETPVAKSDTRPSTLELLRRGIGYARATPSVSAALAMTAMIFPFASIIFALLPLKARALGWDAVGYGSFFAALGVGAVCGALILPRLRLRYGLKTIVFQGTFILALLLLALGTLEQGTLLLSAMAVGGVGWIAVLSSLQAALQIGTPRELQGRVLSIYLVVFGGAQTLGSVAWGLLADATSLDIAFFASGATLLVVSFLVWRTRLKI